MIFYFSHYRYAAGSPMQCIPNLQQNSFAIFPPLTVPETQFFKALGGQEFLPFGIVLLLHRKPVLGAVQFDGEFCGGTIEIEPVDANRVLPAKFESGEAAGFQDVPQFFFIIRLLAAQAACIGDGIHLLRIESVSKNDKLPSP
jgi:hypothetical protein